MAIEKVFLNNLELLFSARENVLNNFKSRLFPIKNLGKLFEVSESIVFSKKFN